MTAPLWQFNSSATLRAPTRRSAPTHDARHHEGAAIREATTNTITRGSIRGQQQHHPRVYRPPWPTGCVYRPPWPWVAPANESEQPNHERTNTTTPPWELSHQQLLGNMSTGCYAVGCYAMGCFAVGCYAMGCNRVYQDAAPQQSSCAMETVEQRSNGPRPATTRQNWHSKRRQSG